MRANIPILESIGKEIASEVYLKMNNLSLGYEDEEKWDGNICYTDDDEHFGTGIKVRVFFTTFFKLNILYPHRPEPTVKVDGNGYLCIIFKSFAGVNDVLDNFKCFIEPNIVNIIVKAFTDSDFIVDKCLERIKLKKEFVKGYLRDLEKFEKRVMELKENE